MLLGRVVVASPQFGGEAHGQRRKESHRPPFVRWAPFVGWPALAVVDCSAALAIAIGEGRTKSSSPLWRYR